MRFPRSFACAALAALTVVVPGSASAQEEAPPVPIPADSMQAAIMEFQTLRQRLAEVQQEALQDSALSTRQAELQELVAQTLFATYPELEEAAERLPALQNEAQAAQAAGDTTRLQAIVQEGQQIQMELQEAQAEVIEQPEIASQVEAFQDDMMAVMKQVDPEIEDVLQRLQLLASRLSVDRG